MKTQTLGHQFRLWTIFLVIVPCLLVMIVYTVGQIKIVKEKNLEMISQRVHSQERLIDHWMMERADNVRRLSYLEAFRSLDEKQMKHTLTLMQQGNKDFDTLSYIDSSGIFKISTFNKEIKYRSAVGQPYFEVAKLGNEYISDVVIGRNSGLPIINFSAPVYNYDGIFQGVILGSVKTTALAMLLSDNWIGQTEEVRLVNQDGIMLTEPRYLNVLIGKGLTKDTAIMKVKLSSDALRNIHLGETGTATWIDYMDEKVMGAYQYMPERGWTLVGNISEAEILKPIYYQLGIMAGVSLLLVLLIMPFVTLITNRIKDPLYWLIKQSKLVMREDYEKIDLENYSRNMPRELSVLCETFIEMSHKIQHTVSLLRENELKLENKVSEIQDMNATLEEEISERQLVEEVLRQLNIKLEDKVYERTRALEEEINKHQAANANLLILNEELQRISLSDGLTGIANRRYFDEFLEREWQRAKRDKTSLALLMIDLDFFKNYNDTYGHMAGDECLKLIAKELRSIPKRSIDIVARYGGEELAFVLPDMNELDAIVMGEQVRVAVEQLAIEHKGSSISESVTVSVGIAVMIPDQDDISAMIIAKADEALYQAKREGRNQVKLAKSKQ
ncbi:diguanylate cyclase [Pelosinus sp. sgz500959]|uniref:sensor domain-containing diguanylate cyclase n=1 Tax=Pelosinus sp. sgz500959 TaxID=3242472 RepID=UPI00366B1107